MTGRAGRRAGPRSERSTPAVPVRLRGIRIAAAALTLAVTTTGCFGYRLVRPEEIEVPDYAPREVLIPAECDELVRRVATGGTGGMREDELRLVDFCQHQQIIRAQEEETAARKLEAHAEAASFALRLTTVVIGGLIAVIAWAF